MSHQGGDSGDYDPLVGSSDNKVDVKGEHGDGGSYEKDQSRSGGTGEAGGYYAEEGDEEEEDDGFAVKLSTQALSNMPTMPTSTTTARGARTAPQAMKTFNASGHGSSSASPVPGGATANLTAKTTASLAPLTTLGGSNRVSMPPNPAIGGLLTQSESSRYYAHLEASSMENYPDKPWEREGADPSDFFNYGFTEATWTLYRERQLALRHENGIDDRTPQPTTHSKTSSTHPNRSSRMDTSGSPHPQYTPSQDSRESRDNYREPRDDTRRSNREDDRSRHSEYNSGSGRSGGDRGSSDRYEERRSSGRGSGSGRDDRRGRDHEESSNRKRGRSPDHRDSRDDENRKRPRR